MGLLRRIAAVSTRATFAASTFPAATAAPSKDLCRIAGPLASSFPRTKLRPGGGVQRHPLILWHHIAVTKPHSHTTVRRHHGVNDVSIHRDVEVEHGLPLALLLSYQLHTPDKYGVLPVQLL